MRYQSVLEADAERTTMTIECSHCGMSLGGDENFCPRCGQKLVKIPKVVTNEVLSEILTKHITKHVRGFEPRMSDKAIAVLRRTHDWLGNLIRDGKCDDHCSECLGASDLADDIWAVLHPEKDTNVRYIGDINPGGDSVSTKPTDDTSVSTFTAPRDWTAKMSEEQQPHCLHGDHRPESCGHCTKNGACDATVLTSFPPQYNMCPFRGSGFIKVEDA